MSCYEWERGTIVIPADQWKGFKERLREIHNQNQARLLSMALTIHAAVQPKGVRGFDWQTAAKDRLKSLADWEAELIEKSLGLPLGFSNSWAEESDKKLRRPLKPKKQDFPLANTSTMKYEADEWYIGLDNAKRSLRWGVHENNHSIERANGHPIVAGMFKALARINWKRNSGGEIIGNDEYNRDSDHAGGGGNYVTHAYGPLGGKKTGVTDSMSFHAMARY